VTPARWLVALLQAIHSQLTDIGEAEKTVDSGWVTTSQDRVDEGRLNEIRP